MLRPVLALRALRAAIHFIRDPRALDQVLALTETMPADEIEARLGHLPAVRAVMDAPAFPPLPSVATLATLPEGTLGRAYADMMTRDGITPEALAEDRAAHPADRFRRHMKLSHDLWHVATGFPTDVTGELGMQAFGLAQYGSPLAMALIAGGLVNALLYAPDRATERMDAIASGWQRGKAAHPLVGFDWHAWLDRPLSDVQEVLGLAAATRVTAEA